MISHWLGKVLRISGQFIRLSSVNGKDSVVSGTAVNYVGAPDNRIIAVVNQVLTPRGNGMIPVLGLEIGCRPLKKIYHKA